MGYTLLMLLTMWQIEAGHKRKKQIYFLDAYSQEVKESICLSHRTLSACTYYIPLLMENVDARRLASTNWTTCHKFLLMGEVRDSNRWGCKKNTVWSQSPVDST
ncbi:Uncharacterized protein Fot_56042 [Forsythia ovata]|uniref:Secreted protein n=1 Tax=Forsythia ovata TaxID=205694 RepID=A0ABD1P2D2_9LAMI